MTGEYNTLIRKQSLFDNRTNNSQHVAVSPTTIASRWKVESSSTTELILGFYRAIQSKTKPGVEVLCESALTLLKTEKYAHLFYRARFIVIGNSR